MSASHGSRTLDSVRQVNGRPTIEQSHAVALNRAARSAATERRRTVPEWARAILVVDDEVELAEAVATGLRREGYAVDVANDGGHGAGEGWRSTPYDLVCLDLTMPDIDGARGLPSAPRRHRPGRCRPGC